MLLGLKKILTGFYLILHVAILISTRRNAALVVSRVVSNPKTVRSLVKSGHYARPACGRFTQKNQKIIFALLNRRTAWEKILRMRPWYEKLFLFWPGKQLFFYGELECVNPESLDLNFCRQNEISKLIDKDNEILLYIHDLCKLHGVPQDQLVYVG